MRSLIFLPVILSFSIFGVFGDGAGNKFGLKKCFQEISLVNPSGDYLYYQLKSGYHNQVVALDGFGITQSMPERTALVSELDIFKKWSLRKFDYLRPNQVDEFYRRADEIALSVSGKQIPEFDRREALMILVKVLRRQLVDFPDSNRTEVKSLIGNLTVSEYFLSGASRVQYYCVYVAWSAVLIFDHWKKINPNLAGVDLFEFSIDHPAHSLNLITEQTAAGTKLYFVDFLRDQFWDCGRSFIASDPDVWSQIEMRDGMIDRAFSE